MQIRAPPEAAKHSEAMLVAGLLVAATAALPSPMTTEFLCSAATNDARCCFTSDALSNPRSFCYATAEENPYYDSSDNLIQCNETIHDVEQGVTFWSVRCPWPPGRDSGLSPGAIAGIAVGAVALVAIAAVVVLF